MKFGSVMCFWFDSLHYTSVATASMRANIAQRKLNNKEVWVFRKVKKFKSSLKQ